jgi:hypothetical protein
VRPPAPPYVGEGPHALWHVSEDPSIERFVPHVPATNPDAPPAVWAVDTRHLPMFWFPRECPRGCVWASERTSIADRQRFLGHTSAARVHVIESAWLDAMRTTRLYAYRLPPAAFVRHEEVGGYWTAVEPTEPAERVEIDDLLGRHAEAGIELRITPSILPWWKAVAASTLEFSGSRLHNASRHPDRMVD